MMRSFFIYLSKANWARKIVTGMSFAWKMASRFVAGEKLEDAIRAIKELNAKGINATLDHLGEHTTTLEEARTSTRDILDALDAIQSTGVRANVSIKLTQLGLGLDPKECANNLAAIVERAASYNNFVRVDMEDSPVTQITLDIMREMRRTEWVAINGAGILPEFQGRGGNALLYSEMEKTFSEFHFKHADLTQVAETAVQMRSDLVNLGGKMYKNHRVFRKVI